MKHSLSLIFKQNWVSLLTTEYQIFLLLYKSYQ